jgi:integrase
LASIIDCVRAADGLVFDCDRTQPFDDSPAGRASAEGVADEGRRAAALHEARHVFASMVIAAPLNAKALSTYTGHSSVTITYDRYGHLTPGNEAEAAGFSTPASPAACDTLVRLTTPLDRS